MSDERSILPAAKPPTEPGRVAPVASLLALVVLAAGVVGIHDALAAWGAIEATSWSKHVVDVFDGFEPSVASGVAGVAVAILGLGTMATAVRPRRTAARRLAGGAGVFVFPSALRGIVRRAAEDQPEVVSSTARVGSRRTTVVVEVSEKSADVRERVKESVAAAVQPLDEGQSISVRDRRLRASS